MLKTLSLDAMGGDHGPQVIVPAGIAALKAHTDIKLIFVGQKDILGPLLEQQGSHFKDRWEIYHASELVAMDESPAIALRMKKDSSLRQSLNLVKRGVAEACISAGNTGALMATARFVLKTLPGIDRPAIMTRFPTRNPAKEVCVLDLGANVDSSAEHLYQFALMGSTLVSAVDNIPNPRVGLLNIGEEQIKGNEQVKRTAELLQKSDVINYIGYVEGNTIFSGVVDVVVCDGFVGNVTLKACEGISSLINYYVKQAFNRNWLTRLAAIPALPVLKSLTKTIDPRRRNGASLLGLSGIVIKSHGSAGVIAFTAAIEEAILEVEKNVPARICQKLEQVLAA